MSNNSSSEKSMMIENFENQVLLQRIYYNICRFREPGGRITAWNCVRKIECLEDKVIDYVLASKVVDLVSERP